MILHHGDAERKAQTPLATFGCGVGATPLPHLFALSMHKGVGGGVGALAVKGRNNLSV
jgi:hypothetical protein